MTARRCSTCRHWDRKPLDPISLHGKNLCTLLSERQRVIDGGGVLTSVDHYCDDWEERKPLVYGESVTESIQRIVVELEDETGSQLVALDGGITYKWIKKGGDDS